MHATVIVHAIVRVVAVDGPASTGLGAKNYVTREIRIGPRLRSFWAPFDPPSGPSDPGRVRLTMNACVGRHLWDRHPIVQVTSALVLGKVMRSPLRYRLRGTGAFNAPCGKACASTLLWAASAAWIP